jgi:hypothetical protein
MARPLKDPVLLRLQVSGEYEQYLKELGMPPELPPAGDLNEADLPVNPNTGARMGLETFSASLSFGSVKVQGVHRQTDGRAPMSAIIRAKSRSVELCRKSPPDGKRRPRKSCQDRLRHTVLKSAFGRL